MNRILNLLAILSTTVAFSQTNPDVFIANIDSDEEKITISGLTNLSNDPGYDNQPSFGTDHLLLFAGNNDGQTDIFQMHSRTGRKLCSLQTPD